MYSVIEFAGQQLKVQKGDKVTVNHVDHKEGSNLHSAYLDGVNLSNSVCVGADLRICSFVDADFSSADLREVQFDRNLFVNTNFSGADLRGGRFFRS